MFADEGGTCHGTSVHARVGLSGDYVGLVYGDDGLAEKCGECGECGDGEIVFSTQPSCYFTWSLANCVGKLLFRQSFFMHKLVEPIGNLKGESCFGFFFGGNVAQEFSKRFFCSFHRLKVLSVMISFSVTTIVPFLTPSLSNSSNRCRVKTYPFKLSSSL